MRMRHFGAIRCVLVGEVECGGSGWVELDAADLARGEDPYRLAGKAEAVAHDEGRVAAIEHAAIVARDELGEIPYPPAAESRKTELPSVRVAREHETRTELDGLIETIGTMTEDDRGHAVLDALRER